MKNKLFAFFVGIVTAVFQLEASVRLPAILGDNMVLQQQADAPVWGKAAPGCKINVKASWGASASTVVASDSTWYVRLRTPSAGGPYSLTIRGDGAVVILRNVLIGEVWLCLGQSNMEMPMKGFPSQPVEGALDAILEANPSVLIRLAVIPRQASLSPNWDCRINGWGLNEPLAVSGASAVAYYFGKCLYENLHVPVGLIMSTWGGTAIEPWMNEESLTSLGYDLSQRKELLDMNPGWAPTALYNAMLAPLSPYAVKGFIWYQGESNRPGNQPGKPRYSKLQADFVQTLRTEFGDGSSVQPFYYVQIAPYPYGDPGGLNSAYMYEQQTAALGMIPNSGMVVTNDIGSESVIHPPQKHEVGRRLALLALQRDYGLLQGLDLAYPMFESMQVDGNKASLLFTVGPGALAPLHKDVEGFEVAGDDHVFHPATARVNPSKRNTVEVSSDMVPVLKAVRYCFHNSQVGTLTSVFGLPACPFRTDDWQ